MGATTFMDISTGKTAKEAFLSARDQALYDCGHGGYTGTIAEKNGFQEFKPDAGMTVKTFLKNIESADSDQDLTSLNQKRAYNVYDDKWGPALCIEVPQSEIDKFCDPKYTKIPEGHRVFIFCGWASE